VAVPGQVPGVRVAPEDFDRPAEELIIEGRGLPEPGPVWLQVDGVQNAADGAGADGRDDAVGDGLAGQVGTGPVGDVQAPGDRLEAGESDNAPPVQGESRAGRPGRAGQANRPATPGPHRVDKYGGRCRRRTAHPGSDLAGPLTGRDGPDGAGLADLEPGGGLAAGEVPQDR
jgi:hypothetical protein